jgi:GT2 family glycosyltransferase
MSIPENLSWELIVVDNNSKDDTKDIVEKVKRQSVIHIKYVFEEKQGLSHARNLGIKEAKGEIICFVDDDIIADSNWLLCMHEAFSLYNPSMVGGKVLLKFDVQPAKWFLNRFNACLGGFDNGDKVIYADNESKELIAIGANVGFKRDLFDKYGFFKTDLGRKGNKLLMGEETEFFWRIKKYGEKCIYYPLALVYHCADSKRMRKNYIRRWYFRIGEWSYFSEKSEIKHKGKQILGIPRWKFKTAFEDLIGSLWYTIKGSKAEAFYKELYFIDFLGYCAQRAKEALSLKRYES